MESVNDYLLSKSFARETESRYRAAISRIAAEFGSLSGLSAVQFRAWLDGQGWGESARWVGFCAVRGYLRWRYGDGHPALKLKIKRLDSGPQRTLKAAEAGRLLASFDTSTIKGRRDLAICSLMLDSGLRSSEVCRLDLAHLDLAARTFSVRVKGGRWGEGIISEYTALYLSDWLSVRCAVPGVDTVFVSLGGNTPGRALTRYGLTVIMRVWGRRVGLAALSPHDLRRTFAVLSTRMGAPARVLQVAGRWTRIEMVERYTRAIEPEDFAGYFPVAGLMRR